MIASPFNFGRRYRPAIGRSVDRRAFTLIEVLAALMLIAIVLPAIMRGITLANAAGTLAKHRTEAGSLAESKLDELVATGNWQNGATKGDFLPDWPNYTWTAELLPFTSGQALGVTGTNAVQELDVHVSWQPVNPQNTVTVSTLVYPGAISTGTTGSAGGLP